MKVIRAVHVGMSSGTSGEMGNEVGDFLSSMAIDSDQVSKCHLYIYIYIHRAVG